MKNVVLRVVVDEAGDNAEYRPGSPMWFEWFASTYKDAIVAACECTGHTEYEPGNFGPRPAWMMESPYGISLVMMGALTVVEVFKVDMAQYKEAAIESKSPPKIAW